VETANAHFLVGARHDQQTIIKSEEKESQPERAGERKKRTGPRRQRKEKRREAKREKRMRMKKRYLLTQGSPPWPSVASCFFLLAASSSFLVSLSEWVSLCLWASRPSRSVRLSPPETQQRPKGSGKIAQLQQRQHPASVLVCRRAAD